MSWLHISILALLLVMWAIFWMAANEFAELEGRINVLEKRINEISIRLARLEHDVNILKLRKHSRFVWDERTGEVLEVPDIISRRAMEK